MAQFINIRKKKVYVARSTCEEKDYVKLYRFREESVEWLANYFEGQIDETRGGALTAKKRMEIFLRFLSDPGFQIRVAKEEGVDRSTVCKVVKVMLPKILAKAHIWIKFPKTSSELKIEQEKWMTRFDFPFGIGAIDCTHVAIQKPSFHGDEYINRKGYCSINVQATCNSNEEFTSIDAQWPGSVHDSRILKQSKVFEIMNNQRTDAVLLGDIGYGIRSWLMTPFKYPRTPEEINYNKNHTKSRVIIERLFGQLKRRFPILQYKVRVDLNKIPSVIICCAVLHNISKYLNDAYNGEPDAEDQEEDNVETAIITNDAHKILGERKRNEIKTILQSLTRNTS